MPRRFTNRFAGFFCTAFLLTTFGAVGTGLSLSQEPRHERADRVTEVTISRNPLLVTATGNMRTGGYTQPRLRPVGLVKNGELVLALTANSPPKGSMVPMVLQIVTATYPIGSDITSVRVVSRHNEIRKRFPGR